MTEEFIHIDQTFEKTIFFGQKLSNREFDGCVFRHCDFSNTVFSECRFIDCTFIDCNLAMAKLPATALQTVAFEQCKLLGIRFDEALDFLFGVHFTDCILDYSWFSRKKMQKTTFANTSLKGVNFEGCDLTSATFDNCNLEDAVFHETILAGADLTTAYHFRIDPEFNPMKKAKFSVNGIPGLLDKYDIKIE
ncbi:pentapeptide repeat-containing protein [Flavobacterium sp.]|uniref:pentapeptide repeat-containing protein n=1 Tax=Flavobacterium sp. TaxID=239 RepID=UPI0039E41506